MPLRKIAIFAKKFETEHNVCDLWHAISLLVVAANCISNCKCTHLRIFINIAHSGCKASSIMPSFKRHSFRVCLFYSCPYNSPMLPPHFCSPTPNHPQSHIPDVQAVKPYRNYRSASLHHICHTLHAHPKKLLKSTLRLLSFSDTPHIHLSIIRFNLSRLRTFSAFIAHASIPYANSVHKLCISFPLHGMMPYELSQDNRLLLEPKHISL